MPWTPHTARARAPGRQAGQHPDRRQGERSTSTSPTSGSPSAAVEERSLTESGQFSAPSTTSRPSRSRAARSTGAPTCTRSVACSTSAWPASPPFAATRRWPAVRPPAEDLAPPHTDRPELPAGHRRGHRQGDGQGAQRALRELRRAGRGSRARLPAARRPPARPRRAAPPLVGREEELAWLREAWSEAGGLRRAARRLGAARDRQDAPGSRARREAAAGRHVRYASCSNRRRGRDLADAVSVTRPTLARARGPRRRRCRRARGLDSLAGEARRQAVARVGHVPHVAPRPRSSSSWAPRRRRTGSASCAAGRGRGEGDRGTARWVRPRRRSRSRWRSRRLRACRCESARGGE